jgi:hypothetical protein
VGKWAKMLTNGSTMRVCGFYKSGQKVGKKWAKWAENGQKSLTNFPIYFKISRSGHIKVGMDTFYPDKSGQSVPPANTKYT